MSNYTIDDTAATLIYGPGWGVASTDDPALSKYFLSTYHATRTPGATMNVTFSGSAIFLYGSTGPNHGNFSVRYDNFVEFLSAYAPSQNYQQLLFSARPGQGTHSLTLTNTGRDQSWFDLDSVMITVPGDNVTSTSTSEVTSTISPLAVASSLALTVTGFSSEVPITTTFATTSNTSGRRITLTLSIVFGALLLLLLVCITVFLTIQRSRRLHYGAGMSSHRKNMSQTTSGSGFFAVRDTPRQVPSTSTISTPPPRPPRPYLPDGTLSPSPSLRLDSNRAVHRYHVNPYPYPNFPDRDETAVTTTDEMSQSPTHSPSQSQMVSRPWSPFRGGTIKLFGSAKEDGADSTRSTFLKV